MNIINTTVGVVGLTLNIFTAVVGLFLLSDVTSITKLFGGLFLLGLGSVCGAISLAFTIDAGVRG